jgi:ATP-dependent RNA helicase DHX37/DHR1
MPKFVPRQRKHKVRQRVKHNGDHSGTTNDSNTVEIVPITNNQKEEKRRRIKDAIHADQPIMSSKKKKRLEKYIVGLRTEDLDRPRTKS